MAREAKSPLTPRITRGLRFRLTVIYVALFALILTGVGLFFRGVLDSIQNDQVSALLEEEWAALRAYLKIQRQRNGVLKHVWVFDHEDPEAAMIVERLRRVCLIADSNGAVMEASADYAGLGVEQPDEIRGLIAANRVSLSIRPDEHGTPYMIRSGVIVDEKKPFFIALGKSLEENQDVLKQFTTYYFSLLPVLILGCGLVGWFASKRALSPVTELAEKTDAISGANLSLRIPLRGAGDEIDHLISTYNNMVERLEQSFNQTRQFSTDVSHELRTPLTVIRGQLEVALMTASSTDQYRDAIVTALQDVERLSNTVRALLHLSQAESGQLTLQRTEFNLSEMAADLSEHFQLLADNERVTLEANLPKRCMVSADRLQIERLISNLLSNAVKYTPAGGRILMSVHRADDQVELVVEDTGQGIPSDALPHIFDRFYRVPGQHLDPEKGLGLGLSFVAWIVRAHDGTINVESTQGVGTRFRVRLPARMPEMRTELKETYGVGD